ncbi:hypothetical protein RCL1_002275 [Eukaryota sp. TZLM3-RCL]
MCDQISSNFQTLFRQFGFSFDRFIRTTDADHEKAVIEMWNLLLKNGHIYKGVHEGWYCTSDEAFLTEMQVEDREKDGELIKVSKESGHPVIRFTEENYMFRLSSFQDKLLEFYENNPEFILPKFRQEEVVQFIKAGLNDFSVSRSNVEWGIRVPNDPTHTIYVWIDALTNYLTGAGFPENPVSWPADYHVIGKDITRFHAIYWPAMLMGAGITQPSKLIVHGWWTANKAKISKSLGNAFDPFETAEKFGLDCLRYFLCRETNISSDGDYSDDQMILRKNSDLADNLGNLVSRVTAVGMNKEQIVPHHGEFTEQDQEVIAAVNALPRVYDAALRVFDTQDALQEVWKVVFLVNKYFTDTAPWKVIKEGTEESKLRV